MTNQSAHRIKGIKLIRILVVGQVPPPWGGQAVMIQKLIDTRFERVDLHFVPMSFSSDMDEIGRFRWKKLFRLPVLVARIWQQRFRTKSHTLYYPPGGESLTAVFRDVVVLLSCRFLFRKVVFHVHAGGFTTVADAAPLPIRLLAKLAYRKPDVVIQLTGKSPPDGMRIKARRIVNVPNGLADEGAHYVNNFRNPGKAGSVNLLFVGVVSPSKGVKVLLEACALLQEQGLEFSLKAIGRFYSPEFEEECSLFIKQHGLTQRIVFPGVLTGDDKWGAFCDADLFCFPSHFESENQSLVVLEAMQFELPCVASDWRGMSTMISDGETGYIVPTKDPEQLADRIGILARKPELRREMGTRAREVFLNSYTDEIWRDRMEKIFRGL